MEGTYVPAGTPEEQVEEVVQARRSVRVIGRIGFAPNPDSYSAGFRAMVLTEPNKTLVETVIPESPAYHAGLFPGDKIEEINGRSTPGLTPQEIRDLVLKPDGPREIKLKVNRNGSLINLNVATSGLSQ